MPEGYGQMAITLLGPYVAWIAAERLHVSAVLACVAGGLYVRQHFSAEVPPLVRMQARSVWELLIFLLNGVIFMLIGLQLGPLRASLEADSVGRIVRWGLLITAAATATRLLWMPIGVAPRAPQGPDAGGQPDCRPPRRCSWWAGPRCAASSRSPRRSPCRSRRRPARRCRSAARSSSSRSW